MDKEEESLVYAKVAKKIDFTEILKDIQDEKFEWAFQLN